MRSDSETIYRKIGSFLVAILIAAGAIYFLIAIGSTSLPQGASPSASDQPPADGSEGRLNDGSAFVPLAIDEELLADFDYKRSAASRDLDGLASFGGRVFFVTADTAVRVTESGKDGWRVRVMAGPEKGRSGWVFPDWIKR